MCHGIYSVPPLCCHSDEKVWSKRVRVTKFFFKKKQKELRSWMRKRRENHIKIKCDFGGLENNKLLQTPVKREPKTLSTISKREDVYSCSTHAVFRSITQSFVSNYFIGRFPALKVWSYCIFKSKKSNYLDYLATYLSNTIFLKLILLFNNISKHFQFNFIFQLLFIFF